MVWPSWQCNNNFPGQYVEKRQRVIKTESRQKKTVEKGKRQETNEDDDHREKERKKETCRVS